MSERSKALRYSDEHQLITSFWKTHILGRLMGRPAGPARHAAMLAAEPRARFDRLTAPERAISCEQGKSRKGIFENIVLCHMIKIGKNTS